MLRQQLFFGSNLWWQTKAKQRLADDYEKITPAIKKAKYSIDSLS